MGRKYLLFGVGLVLFLILSTLIILTLVVRKNDNTTPSKNRPKVETQNYDVSIKREIAPPNGAIEDIVAPKNSSSNSLTAAIESNPDEQNNLNQLNINEKTPNPTITNKLTPATTDYIKTKKNLSSIPTLYPTPTPYQFASEDSDVVQFMGSKLGPDNSSNIKKVKYKPVPTLSTVKSAVGNNIITRTSQYQYFTQCDGGFDDYSLPQGCNLCEAGCGPTTIAMILSNYLGQTYTPADVVEIYKQNGFYAGCDGTKVTDAMTVLEMKGLQTTDFLMLIPMNKEEAIAEMKKYIDTGWTIFMLGRYCPDGCGHFFWITDIDDNNKVWSYDPFYNKDSPPPLDVAKYEPFPEYRIAFGVKR